MKKNKNFKVKIRIKKNPNVTEKERYKKLFSIFDILLVDKRKSEKIQKAN